MTMPAGVSDLQRASAPLQTRGVRQGARAMGPLGQAIAPTDNATTRRRPGRRLADPTSVDDDARRESRDPAGIELMS
jgi:hypothetical protein